MSIWQKKTKQIHGGFKMQSSYDVVVIGGGSAGLTAAAILANEGKRTLICEASPWIGGRAGVFTSDGFKLNLGGHLLEDSGSGMTAIYRYLGLDLKHGPMNTSLPIFKEGRWWSIKDLYKGDKAELKRMINLLGEMKYDDFDSLDDIPLRTWMLGHTKSESVISLFEYLAVLECMTEHWNEHAASDNLFVRKMHYEEKKMAGYSFWPDGGWDHLFGMLHDYIEKKGGVVWTHSAVDRIIIKNGRVEGLYVYKDSPELPGEIPDPEYVEADCVICTAPIWNVLDMINEEDLPRWYAERIRFLSQDKFKTCWLGYYVASKEPIYALDPLETCTWESAPVSKLGGFAFLNSALDPEVAPDGLHLWVCGASFIGMRSKKWINQKIREFEKDLEIMLPDMHKKGIIWKKRHLVGDPPFGLVQMPGLVGTYRPGPAVPGVEGLFFAGDTYKSRGIGVDRAARSGVTAAELALGKRVDGLEETWRY